MLKSPAPRSWARMLSQIILLFYFIFWMGYRKECCKIFGYIQNLKLKKSGPTIVGPDAFTNNVFTFGLNFI
jgi:hypothetical protein